MARAKLLIAFFAIVCGLLVCNDALYSATYVFGEDGNNTDLTGSGAGSSWSSSDVFIIAGDCNVPDDSTLTIGAGVNVYFDYDYGGDVGAPAYPTITVYGTLDCNGTSSSKISFTNYSGKIKGEFEGIYLDGDSTALYDYEGTLEAEYTQFLYGGYTYGIVRVGERAIMDVENCEFRHSDNHEIYIQDSGNEVDLLYCQIDSCDYSGICATDNATDYTDLSVKGCTFADIDSVGIDWPRENPRRDPVTWHNTFKWTATGIRSNREETWVIRNHYFFGCFVGVGFRSNQMPETGENNHIYNSVFAECTIGISFLDLDAADGGNEQDTHIENCVFWACTNGLHFNGWQCNDGNWPDDHLTLRRNLFGQNTNNDIWNGVAPIGDDPPVPNTNAFPNDDNVTNVDIGAGPLVEDEDGAWELVDEIGNDGPDNDVRNDLDSYDFHIKFTEDSPLINADNTAEDHDGTDVDVGCYGGNLTADEGIGLPDECPGGINWQPDDWGDFADADPWGDDPYGCAYYVYLHSDEFDANVTLPASTYHFNADLNNDPAEVLTVTAPANFCAQGDYNIDVLGEFVAVGTAANIIRFVDGTCGNDNGWGGDGWAGIEIRNGADFDTEFEFCEICGVADDEPAIHFNNCGAGWIDIIESEIHHNGSHGVRSDFNSQPGIVDCNIHDNDGDGIHIADLTTQYGFAIEESFIHDNGGHGFYMEDSDPEFNSDAENTQIHENGEYGFYLKNSSPDLQNAPAENELWHNTDGEIYIRTDGCDPKIEANDIEPLNPGGGGDKYAIEWHPDADRAFVNGEYVWWGTEDADDDEDRLFSHPNRIDYDPWEDGDWVDEFEDYDLALNAYREGNYSIAINYLENCIGSENYRHAQRATAIRFLLGAYFLAERDLDDLRNFLSDAAAEVEDEEIAFIASEYAIWSMIYEERYGDMLNAYLNRRDAFDNRIDSLKNEIRILKAGILVEEDNRGHDNDSFDLVSYDRKKQELYDMISALRAGGKSSLIIPQYVALNEPYPNPFNHRTTVGYSLNDRVKVTLAVYDISGKQVAVIESGVREAGQHGLTWNAENFTSGVYFIKLQTPDQDFTRKLSLVK